MPAPRLASTHPMPADEAPPEAVIRTLLMTDLVDSTRMVAQLGDSRAAAVATRHDRAARDLLRRFRGLEIDKTDGFLLLFERPIDAVGYALAYHQALADLSHELEVELTARAGIHLGEVMLRQNPDDDVDRGAKRLEAEGIAKPMTARVMSLAVGGQTLLTHGAFDLARRSAIGNALPSEEVAWRAHGLYEIKGVDEPLEIFEVGTLGAAPLTAPHDTAKAHRQVAEDHETILGWRPAPDQVIPQRPNWILRERIGLGGFGEVWLATQSKTRQKRVFKFCLEANRLRSLQREVTLFRLLRETLGHRDDIARVLDWNFDEPPYFLESEYTEGGNLAQWAEEQGGLEAIPLAIRLELVAQVAEALAAAHSVGILHKDIKPTNILVTTDRDGHPKARLTDFGIGLVDDSVLAEHGITRLGLTEVLPADAAAAASGTYVYMAPEVVEGKVATIQADIYALGIILYQMVAGDFSHPLAQGWRRDVPDVLLADDIARTVDGAPQRRPGSAAELAHRLRRLDQRRAEAATRRAQAKAHRRRKLYLSFGGVATAVLLAVSILAVQAMQARREADLRRLQAEELISFMVGDLATKLQPLGRLDIMREIGDQAMQYFAAVPQEKLTPEELNQRLDALDKIGYANFIQGDTDAAIAAFQEALSLASGLTQRAPENVDWQKRLGVAHFAIGRVFWVQGDQDEALAHFESQLEISQRLALQHPAEAAMQLELANARTNVGFVYRARGDLERAAEEFGAGLNLMEASIARAPEDTDLLFEYTNKAALAGSLAWQLGEVVAARRYYEDSHRVARGLVERDSTNTFWQARLGITHNVLGRTLAAADELAEARRHFQANLEIFEQLTAIEPLRNNWQRELAMAHRLLSQSLRSRGQFEGAREHATRGTAILKALVVENPQPDLQRDLAALLIARAEAQLTLGAPATAQQLTHEALALLEPLAEQSPEDRATHLRLGEVLLTLGHALTEPADARRAFTRAAEALEPFARDSRDLDLLGPWQQVLERLGRQEEATLVAQRAEDLRQQLRAAGTATPNPNGPNPNGP